MKHLTLCLIALLWAVQVSAEQPVKAQVLLMGTFHFANPGLDTVKTETGDVMEPANQDYLDALAERIAATKPTKILLEYDREDGDKINQQYKDYIAGNFELPVNEIYQVGFRVARLAGLKRLYSFDDREISWKAAPMFEYMEKHAPGEKQRFEAMIAGITQKLNDAHATLSLKNLLRYFNNPELDKANMALYLTTNHVGAGKGFVGADASASWWHRNFRMYALVQHHALPGDRVFVLGGQGHTAIFRQLLALDPDRESVNINELL
ncbi:MAG: DUF5694 domain-containing protein [Pseudomonadales bacterium]